MNINLLTRVAVDKNYFMDFVVACYLSKNRGCTINVKFIGKIHSNVILETVERAIQLLGLQDQVRFTGAPVKINEIQKKDDYYFNLSIADFVGYSSIESIDNELKTMFYNIDDNLQNVINTKFIYVNSFHSLCEKLELIYNNRYEYDQIIRQENLELGKEYFLNEKEVEKLKEMFK